MTTTIKFHEIGNIGSTNRALRAGLGMLVLIAAMFASANTGMAYPIIKLAAAFVVLTGIIGWDPMAATVRSLRVRFGYAKPMNKAALNPS